MGRENIMLGKFGEQVALEFLKRNGYRILETNFRTCFGEIDVIARRKDVLVFIEVKTRATSSLGPPYLSVTMEKARRLIKNALVYVTRYGLVNSHWRIDVISVKLTMNWDIEHIEHIQNAVEDP